MSQTDGPRKADVALRLPADGAYISVLRTTAAGLAARLDFTIEDIEDLRMAVGEASAIVLREADPGTDLACTFDLAARTMTVSLTVQTSTPTEPDHDDFAWQVLSTLSTAEVTTDAGHFTVTLSLTSAVAATGS